MRLARLFPLAVACAALAACADSATAPDALRAPSAPAFAVDRGGYLGGGTRAASADDYLMATARDTTVIEITDVEPAPTP